MVFQLRKMFFLFVPLLFGCGFDAEDVRRGEPRSMTFIGNLDQVADRQTQKLRATPSVKMKEFSAEFCRVMSDVKIVDTSEQLTDDFLKVIQSFGVEVVARYYGYSREHLPPGFSKQMWDNQVNKNGKKNATFQANKIISKGDVNLLKKYRMASLAVFQYRNDEEKTFKNWKVRAPADAARALSMAGELGQSSGAIYFGVDADIVNGTRRACKRSVKKTKAVSESGKEILGEKEVVGNCKNQVLDYFRVVSPKIKEAGFAVGVYGSGETCKILTAPNADGERLVDYCWLNFSTGHTNRRAGLESKFTVLRQLQEAKSTDSRKKCGHRNIDFNAIHGGATSFGAFIYK